MRAVNPPRGEGTVVANIPHGLDTAQLAGSASLIGVQQADFECNETGCKYQNWLLEGEELLAGPPGAAPQCLAGSGVTSCARLAPCWGVAGLLVSLSRIAYQECGSGDTGQTVVVDYSTTPPTRSVVPQIALPESISGPWLIGLSPSWNEPSGVARPAPALVERNLETGAEPLHIELPETGAEFATESRYPALASVQEDGRIAYVIPKETAYGPAPESVFTASPAEPRPRPILSARVSGSHGQPFIPDQRLLLASDLLAVEERLPNRDDPPEPLQRLELASLAGQRLGGVELGENEEVGFDFNGSELVAVKTPCVESFMTTWGAAQPQPTKAPGGVCPPPRLARISLGRRGLTAAIACPTSPALGCLQSTVRVELRIRGRAVSSRGGADDLFPGQRTTLTTPLGARAVRWLREHRNVSVNVQIESGYGGPASTRRRLR